MMARQLAGTPGKASDSPRAEMTVHETSDTIDGSNQDAFVESDLKSVVVASQYPHESPQVRSRRSERLTAHLLKQRELEQVHCGPLNRYVAPQAQRSELEIRASLGRMRREGGDPPAGAQWTINARPVLAGGPKKSV